MAFLSRCGNYGNGVGRVMNGCLHQSMNGERCRKLEILWMKLSFGMGL